MVPNAENVSAESLHVIVSRALQEIIHGGMLTTDRDLTITGWNHWLEINTRRPANSVVGRNLLEVYPDLAARHIDQSYRKALAGQVVVLSQRIHKYVLPMPATVARAGLTEMQQTARIAPLVEDGQVLGTLTLIEDVTERAVYDSEQTVRANQQAGVADLGRQALAGDSLIILVERACATIGRSIAIEQCALFELSGSGASMTLTAGTGWQAGIVGQMVFDAASDPYPGFSPSGSQQVIVTDVATLPPSRWRTVLMEHGVARAITVPVLARQTCLGVLGVFSAGRSTLLSEDIHVIQAVANVLGLAIEGRRLDHALRGRVEQLALADQRKDEFLAMLAHELRNPLAPIMSAMDFLKLTESPTDNVRLACEVIERQVGQMKRLIDDLLDVARITQGKIALRQEPFDAAVAAARAVEISRPLIDAGRHNLVVSLPPQPQWILGDATRVAQVLANLLNNAAKYTDAGGQISLHVERHGNRVVFRIRDSGVGIPADLLPHVFDLFMQVNRSLDRAQGGLGIGLTLVRRIVELHGGTVHASSEGSGKGSEFSVELPVIERPELDATPIGANASSEKASGVLDILVVDDNTDAAHLLALLLKALGHRVQTASTGLQAIEIARSAKPNVIFLDIGLPGMDGYEVARQLRCLYGHDELLLVALTGYGRPDDMTRAREAGFSHHLTKPVNQATLDKLLHNAVDRDSGISRNA